MLHGGCKISYDTVYTAICQKNFFPYYIQNFKYAHVCYSIATIFCTIMIVVVPTDIQSGNGRECEALTVIGSTL